MSWRGRYQQEAQGIMHFDRLTENLLAEYFRLFGWMGFDYLQASRQIFSRSSSAKSSRLMRLTVLVFRHIEEEASLKDGFMLFAIIVSSLERLACWCKG